MQIFEVEVFKVFVLVLVRFSGLVVSAPVLGSRNLPVMAKVGIAGFSALLVTFHVPALQQGLPNDFLAFAWLAAGEVLIGLMMGFVMTLVFAAIQVGGQMVDMLSGFALVNVFNPAMETQVPVFGFFYYIIAGLYLLVINGHHLMIRHLVATFDKIPLGGFMARPDLFYDVSTWGSAMFFDGLLIAAPVAGVLLLAYVTMGLMGRVVPQIHLFVVGFPLTIGMALLVTGLSLGIYLNVIDGMFERMFGGVRVVVAGMSGNRTL